MLTLFLFCFVQSYNIALFGDSITRGSLQDSAIGDDANLGILIRAAINSELLFDKSKTINGNSSLNPESMVKMDFIGSLSGGFYATKEPWGIISRIEALLGKPVTLDNFARGGGSFMQWELQVADFILNPKRLHSNSDYLPNCKGNKGQPSVKEVELNDRIYRNTTKCKELPNVARKQYDLILVDFGRIDYLNRIDPQDFVLRVNSFLKKIVSVAPKAKIIFSGIPYFTIAENMQDESAVKAKLFGFKVIERSCKEWHEATKHTDYFFPGTFFSKDRKTVADGVKLMNAYSDELDHALENVVKEWSNSGIHVMKTNMRSLKLPEGIQTREMFGLDCVHYTKAAMELMANHLWPQIHEFILK